MDMQNTARAAARASLDIDSLYQRPDEAYN